MPTKLERLGDDHVLLTLVPPPKRPALPPMLAATHRVDPTATYAESEGVLVLRRWFQRLDLDFEVRDETGPADFALWVELPQALTLRERSALRSAWARCGSMGAPGFGDALLRPWACTQSGHEGVSGGHAPKES